MLRKVTCFLIVCLGTASATVRHVAIKSAVVLKPGEVYTVQVESAKPVEIGWTAVEPCNTNCIEATQLGTRFGFATGRGFSKIYQPADGKVAVEYKNTSQEPVTIDVFRLVRICDAESCRLLDNSKKGHTLVFKVAKFKSITTSKDESYSVIAGVVQSGRPFRLFAVWFTDDKNFMNLRMGCTTWIARYVDNHWPTEKYAPYVISGQNVGDGDTIVLRSIDACLGKADHYGATEGSIFK